MENEFLDSPFMQKIKNMAQENQQIKTQLSTENRQRIAAEEALKAEISCKITL